MSWSGCNFHCIKCGTSLEEEPPPDPEMDIWDFDTDKEFTEYCKTPAYLHSNLYYNTFGDSNTYHCKNQECPCKEIHSVVLFHPLGDIGSTAGDSLAFGIQCNTENDIFCFMCGSTVDKNKMCCMGKKCCFNFDHCLDIIDTPKTVFGLGFIK
jgi:hypothetical protein